MEAGAALPFPEPQLADGDLCLRPWRDADVAT